VPLQESFKALTTWWKDVLGSDVIAVKVSNRLAKSPAIVVTGQYGWSANMERIMKAQALTGDDKSYMKGQKTLEINPRHPLVQELRTKVRIAR
jgi:heat shock protein beta